MIKECTLSDRPEFLRLFQMFLTDQRKAGSHIHDSIDNLMIYRKYFDSYVIGSLFGMCLLWYPEGETEMAGGVLLGGEYFTPEGLETDHGKTIHCWGVYVIPEHRGNKAATQLQAHAIVLSIKLGFNAMTTVVRIDNNAGLSLALDQKPYGFWVYYADLRKALHYMKENKNG